MMEYQKYEVFAMSVIAEESEVHYRLDESRTVYEFARDILSMDMFTEERLYAVSVNAKGDVIGFFEVSRGTATGSMASTREIFKGAILSNAVAIVLLHNHPSGDPTPSNDDVKTTKKICEAGKLMDINVVDHVIVGDGGFISLRAEGVIQ